jgi:hypothetical protein
MPASQSTPRTESKTCTRCGESKRIVEFHRSRYYKDGRHARCAECRRTLKRAKDERAKVERPDSWKQRRANSDAKDRASPSRRSARIQHARDRRITRYGLTVTEFETLLASQGGRCAICRTEDPHMRTATRLQVDHDHTTGEVRGLLCDRCNKALAGVGDNLEGLMKFVDYLSARVGPSPSPGLTPLS